MLVASAIRRGSLITAAAILIVGLTAADALAQYRSRPTGDRPYTGSSPSRSTRATNPPFAPWAVEIRPLVFAGDLDMTVAASASDGLKNPGTGIHVNDDASAGSDLGVEHTQSITGMELILGTVQLVFASGAFEQDSFALPRNIAFGDPASVTDGVDYFAGDPIKTKMEFTAFQLANRFQYDSGDMSGAFVLGLGIVQASGTLENLSGARAGTQTKDAPAGWLIFGGYYHWRINDLFEIEAQLSWFPADTKLPVGVADVTAGYMDYAILVKFCPVPNVTVVAGIRRMAADYEIESDDEIGRVKMSITGNYIALGFRF
jgi:hypothetical protein